MKFYKRFYMIYAVILMILMTVSTSWAVIILDSTYKKYGFKKAEALALEPQFSSLIYLSGDGSSGSGTWIGNYKGHGYVLTAAHMFDEKTKASDYGYWTLNNVAYYGEAVFMHPLWNADLKDRTGYDFAVVRLTEEVDDIDSQPVLYVGNEEKEMVLTFIGYGYRGKGSGGQNKSIDTKYKPAAAQGLIEFVEPPIITPAPKSGDVGNYMGIWLPKENGSLKNPWNDKGITTPVSPLAGLLGSGDSGGPAWIKTDKGWAIAGINSNGDNNAGYGDLSWFPRVSGVKEWIKKLVPTAQFSDQEGSNSKT